MGSLLSEILAEGPPLNGRKMVSSHFHGRGKEQERQDNHMVTVNLLLGCGLCCVTHILLAKVHHRTEPNVSEQGENTCPMIGVGE